MKKYSLTSLFLILFFIILFILLIIIRKKYVESMSNESEYGSGKVGVRGYGVESRKCPPGFKHFIPHTYPYKGKCVLKYGTTLFPSYPECCKRSLRSLWEVSTKPPKSTYFRTKKVDKNPLFPLTLNIHEGFSGKEFEMHPPLVEDKSLSGNYSDKKHYWCNAGLNTCVKKRVNRHQFWRNNCGPTSISATSAPIYYSEKDCMRNGNQCTGLNRRDCLSKNSCGWCVDGKGKGKCVKGTAEGPLDMGLYPYCVPQLTQYSTFDQNQKYRNQEANTWIQGYADPYVHDTIQDHV
jgi:hypothetical protein